MSRCALFKPGTYTYTVKAAHVKEFFGDCKVGDKITFVEVKGVDPNKPRWNNPTDYLRLEK